MMKYYHTYTERTGLSVLYKVPEGENKRDGKIYFKTIKSGWNWTRWNSWTAMTLSETIPEEEEVTKEEAAMLLMETQ